MAELRLRKTLQEVAKYSNKVLYIFCYFFLLVDVNTEHRTEQKQRYNFENGNEMLMSKLSTRKSVLFSLTAELKYLL
jgi:hypothetical protein